MLMDRQTSLDTEPSAVWNTTCCVSHPTLERQGVHPQEQEDVPDRFPRKEIWEKSSPWLHRLFSDWILRSLMLGGLVPGLILLQRSELRAWKVYTNLCLLAGE